MESNSSYRTIIMVGLVVIYSVRCARAVEYEGSSLWSDVCYTFLAVKKSSALTSASPAKNVGLLKFSDFILFRRLAIFLA